MQSSATEWQNKFWDKAADESFAASLKAASLLSDNRKWTEVLTSVAVETCRSMGWKSAAKGHKLNILPEGRNEYLGIDVMAFAGSKAHGNSQWRPLSWKTVLVKNGLRILFGRCCALKLL